MLTAARIVHLLLGETELVVDPALDLRGQIIHALKSCHAMPGDVLVVELSSESTSDELRHELAAGDLVVQRGDAIWDIYRSPFADEVLAACGVHEPAQQTQARRAVVDKHTVVQVAVYPTPSVSAGVRLWCDPSLKIVFVGPGGFDDSLRKWRDLATMWERLRAHHGRGMSAPYDPRLEAAYPIPRPHVAVSAQARSELEAAVAFVASEQAVDDILSSTSSPQGAVERTLRARRTLLDHTDRLVAMLDHTHGSAQEKWEMLETELTLAYDSTVATQLGAPHRHLVDGLEETRRDLARLADRASTTAELVASTAVGRLLDRSDANRALGAVVATGLVVLSAVSTFTSIASLPADQRNEISLSRLAGWVCVAALVLAVGAFGLSRLAARPALRTAPFRRKVRLGEAAGVAVALGSFGLGGLTSNAVLDVAGGLLVLAVVVVHRPSTTSGE